MHLDGTSKKAECPILLVKKKYYPDFHFPEHNAIAEICATLPFFTLSNNEVGDKDDRLCKLRVIIDYLNEKFISIYIPEEYVSLDESLMKYTGRMSYKQFNPSKRARFGVKFYKLCESKSGYCMKFKIYTGQDKVENSITSASENVSMFMCIPIANFGHTLFMDNWYSSPNLFQKLQSMQINAIGDSKMQ